MSGSSWAAAGAANEAISRKAMIRVTGSRSIATARTAVPIRSGPSAALGDNTAVFFGVFFLGLGIALGNLALVRPGAFTVVLMWAACQSFLRGCKSPQQTSNRLITDTGNKAEMNQTLRFIR